MYLFGYLINFVATCGGAQGGEHVFMWVFNHFCCYLWRGWKIENKVQLVETVRKWKIKYNYLTRLENRK